MKNLFRFTLLFAFIALSFNIYADVKVKIRQTFSGQSFENTTYIKGKRQRTEQNMGGMQTVNITQCDLKRDLQLMPVAKTYTVDLWGTVEQTAPAPTQTVSLPTQKGGLVTTTYTIKDTGERKKMFGYEARHLIITLETESSPDACQKTKSRMVTDGWYIDASFGLDCDLERNNRFYKKPQSSGCQDRFVMKQSGTGNRGYAVYEKMTMFDENGKESMTMVSEVLEFSKATLEDSLFEVPADYKQIKDSQEMFASIANSVKPSAGGKDSSGNGTNLPNLADTGSEIPANLGAKKEGVVRFGLAEVKIGAVGDGLAGADLAAAVRNTLGMFLKVPNVEVVMLEGKLPDALETEAKQKECDYLILMNASHKKGGGGFGMFTKIAPALGNIVPVAGLGGTVAGQATSAAIYTAASLSGKIKSKDEIALEVKLQQSSGATAFSKQYKAKAKSDGEDIISVVIEQAAQAILEASKK